MRIYSRLLYVFGCSACKRIYLNAKYFGICLGRVQLSSNVTVVSTIKYISPLLGRVIVWIIIDVVLAIPVIFCLLVAL